MKGPAYDRHTVFLTLLGANLIMLVIVSCILLFNRPSTMLTDISGISKSRYVVPVTADLLESGQPRLVRRQAGYAAVSRSIAMAAGSRTKNFGPASGRVNLLCAQAQEVIPDLNNLLQKSF